MVNSNFLGLWLGTECGKERKKERKGKGKEEGGRSTKLFQCGGMLKITNFWAD